MEALIIDLKQIYFVFLLLSVCIGAYAFVVMKKMKLGFFNTQLFTSQKDFAHINTVAYIFPLVFSLFFIVVDTILWLVRWDTVVVLISLALKIILYKIFEFYYIVKARKVHNEIHRYYPRYSGTFMLPLTGLVLMAAQLIFFLQFSWIILCATMVVEGFILYILHKNHHYTGELIMIKCFEALTLGYLFFIAEYFGHQIAYAAIVGLFVIL